jgi:hypothetical protein
MMPMRILLCVILFLPFLAMAASVVSSPEKASEVLQIEQIEVPQEYFGKLKGFPHTYEFAVGQTLPFKASVSVHDSEAQATDASLIVIKEEKRGVSEVGRTKGKNEAWGSEHDAMLIESFKNGGFIESELKPGVYRLEVSSPNNDATYRLVIGTENISRGYFENVGVLFEVKSLLGSSKLGMVRSPLIYWPLSVIVVLGGLLLYIYMYRNSPKRSSRH